VVFTRAPSDLTKTSGLVVLQLCGSRSPFESGSTVSDSDDTGFENRLYCRWVGDVGKRVL